MNRIPVESSNLSSIGYDPKTQTLEVEFKNHTVWQYHGVSENMWQELLAAPSKGKYYANQIRNRFASTSHRVS